MSELTLDELDVIDKVIENKKDNPPVKQPVNIITPIKMVNTLDIDIDETPTKPIEPKARYNPYDKSSRITVNINDKLLARMKNAIYWLSEKQPKIAMNYLIEQGLSPLLDKLEKDNGGPFKSAEGGLKRGRRKK